MDEQLITEFKQQYRAQLQSVSVVASRNGAGETYGVTIGSDTSLSIAPPSIMFSLNLNSQTHNAIMENKYFTINHLSADQQQIAEQFASPISDRFQNIDFTLDEKHQQPVIAESLGACVMQLAESIIYADHVIIIGTVQHIIPSTQLLPQSPLPLTYRARQYNYIK